MHTRDECPTLKAKFLQKKIKENKNKNKKNKRESFIKESVECLLIYEEGFTSTIGLKEYVKI